MLFRSKPSLLFIFSSPLPSTAPFQFFFCFLIHNVQATLSLPSINSSTTNDSIEFQGKFDPSKDGLDCVAIFDATTETFRLELIHGGQATLRHMPGSKRDKDLAGTKKKLIPGSGATAEDNPAEETRDMNIKKGNVAVAVAPIAAPSIKTVAAVKGRKPAAAVIKVSKDKEEIIEDEFFHGALD